MLGFLKGKGKRLVGIDFGASALKVVSGKMQGSKFSVEALGVEALPDELIDDRGVQNAQQVLEALLHTLEVAQQNDPKKAFGTAVHGNGIYTKRIILPKMKDKEIPEAVRWEAEQVLPQDLSSIIVDYLNLGPTNEVPNAPKGTKGIDIMLVGVHNEDVMSLKNIADEAGIDLRLIDLDCFVVGDLLESFLKLSKKKPTALVDVGATATRIGVRYKGNTVFQREFPIGGRSFTEVIASNLGLSISDAESLKLEAEESFPEEATEALANIFAEWKEELQQTEDIFVSQESDLTIKEWFVFGGGSLTPGLVDSIEKDRFSGNVKLVPFKKLFKKGHKSVDSNILDEWAPRLITAAGVGCRSA